MATETKNDVIANPAQPQTLSRDLLFADVKSDGGFLTAKDGNRYYHNGNGYIKVRPDQNFK